jgi:hypothetical protein
MRTAAGAADGEAAATEEEVVRAAERECETGRRAGLLTAEGRPVWVSGAAPELASVTAVAAATMPPMAAKYSSRSVLLGEAWTAATITARSAVLA